MGEWKGEKSFREFTFILLFIYLFENPFSICYTTRLNVHSILLDLLPLQFLQLSVSLLWIGKPKTTRRKKSIFSFTLWSYFIFSCILFTLLSIIACFYLKSRYFILPSFFCLFHFYPISFILLCYYT